jgi:hypothetical protein
MVTTIQKSIIKLLLNIANCLSDTTTMRFVSRNGLHKMRGQRRGDALLWFVVSLLSQPRPPQKENLVLVFHTPFLYDLEARCMQSTVLRQISTCWLTLWRGLTRLRLYNFNKQRAPWDDTMEHLILLFGNFKRTELHYETQRFVCPESSPCIRIHGNQLPGCALAIRVDDVRQSPYGSMDNYVHVKMNID